LTYRHLRKTCNSSGSHARLSLPCLVVLAIAIPLLAVVAQGCTWPLSSSGASGTATPATAHETPTLSPSDAVAEPSVTPVPAEQQTMTLTLWIPATFNGLDATDEWQTLQSETEDLYATHPNLRVRYIRKKASGTGGLVDFLRDAREVAPAVLPDLVILPSSQVDAAIRSGQLQPMDTIVPPSLVQGLYSFATANTVDEHLMALGLAVDVEHLAYDPIRLARPPRTWADVLNQGQRYIFPAAGEGGQVNDASLIQYLAAGGMLVDSEGKASLDTKALSEVFVFYAQAVSRGVILSDTLQIDTSDEAWREYLKGKGAMSVVSSRRFLQDGLRRNTTSFASIPTVDGRKATLARGWTIALITDDTDRLDAISLYLAWLFSPEVLGKWCQKLRHLPATRSALGVAVPDEMYRDFLNVQLESAGVRPSSPAAAKASTAMQRALQGLLQGNLSPDAAVQAAVNLLH